MSDKETAPWMKEAAESIALAALRYRTFQMPTCIAEIIAAHCPVAAECTAPAPQPCGKNMGNDLLVIPCDLPRDHKGPCERNVWPVNEAPLPQPAIVPLDGRDSWTEEELANFGKLASQPQPVPTEHLIRAAATPQVTPELELEQESDGRWIAELLGVAAYGPSKEEAIRNAAKVLIESTPEQASYPNDPSLMCAEGRHKECTGSNQPWWVCGCACHKKASEQASPTPEQCPTCGHAEPETCPICKHFTFEGKCHLSACRCPNCGHSSGTPKGTK